MMIVAGIFLYLICGSVPTSGSIYGVEVYAGDEWWTYSFFLKFYSPSGKNYLIDYETGEISLESLDSVQESAKDVTPPYISFVALNLKVYDIHFKQQGYNYIPQIVEKPVSCSDKSTFIRHSLHSFVGPNNQTYTLTYDNISNIIIESEKPVKQLANLQIKTLGPYAKWEHTYSFSQNGDTATDLTLSSVETTADRSIPLAEMEAGTLKDRNAFLVNFNTPSAKRYLITNKIDIARDQDAATSVSYVAFVEPNGKEYDIYFQQNGIEHVPRIVAKDMVGEDIDQNNFDRRTTTQLLSFVGPDKKLYQISRQTENGEDVPVIDLPPKESTDLRVTVVVTSKYFKKYVNFIFVNEGEALHDRVDEIDSTLLAEQPALSVDEVEANSEIAKASFATFYSPSGRIYYLTPENTVGNVANFAVDAKGSHNTSDSPYISFHLQDGRTGNIYYAPSGDTDLKFSPADGTNSSSQFSIVSFVTPDKKFHKMLTHVDKDTRTPYIDNTAQPKDALDEKPEETLRIVLGSTSREYVYVFTWNGDKLIAAITVPRKRVSTGVLKSLIG